MVDRYGTADAVEANLDLEFERNGGRYSFLRCAQQNFDNFRVVPPGTGICHQVNVESLAPFLWPPTQGERTTSDQRRVGHSFFITFISRLSPFLSINYFSSSFFFSFFFFSFLFFFFFFFFL